MKINLGCGNDYKNGYVNIDMKEPCDIKCDLSVIPWAFENNSVDEILMLDFLEHFPYRSTDNIIQECWRILKVDGFVDIQVPDFEHCAYAACDLHHYLCNVCGNSGKNQEMHNNESVCAKCRTPIYKIAQAAIMRLYGGQDFEGNFHYTAFTQDLLKRKLENIGFRNIELLEKHHQWKNWNFKMRAFKVKDLW